MKKKKRNRVLITIAVIVAVILVFLVFRFVVFGNGPEVPEVETTRIGIGDVEATVSAEGELRARNQVDISAETMATIEKIFIEEGDYVEKGALLCLLDDDELSSDRRLYQAQYNESKASYQRGKILYEEGLISLAKYEQLRTSYEVAGAQLEKSRDGLGETRIYAPISGQVIAAEVEAGETVVIGTMNNAGTVMFTIADLSDMQAEIYVDETDIVAVAQGQPAKITLDALPNTDFAAEVHTVGYMPAAETELSSGVTEFKVVLNVKDKNISIRPGMSVFSVITTAVRKDVLVCPLQAIGEKEIDGEMKDTVFVLERGRAKLVPIETGISDGAMLEILDGLTEGMEIISGPYNTLRTLNDGDVVKPYKSKEGKWQGKEEESQGGKDFVRGLGRMTGGRGK